MPRLPSSLFAQADLDHITAAINEAESKTPGEIVPFGGRSSDGFSGGGGSFSGGAASGSW